MSGIEIYTKYGIDDGIGETDGFVSPVNHEGETIRVKWKEIFTEQDKFIQLPRFYFKRNHTRKREKRLYPSNPL